MVTRRDAHPSPGVLQAFGLGKLDDDSAGTVLNHLETCSDCRRQVEAQSGDGFLDRLRQAHRPGSGTAAYQGLAQDRILFKCPRCGKALRAKVSVAGKKVKCPNCSETLDVPGTGPAKEKTTLPPESAETGGPPGPAQRPAQGETDWELCNFLAPAQAPDELGQLGPYRVLAVLGAGGMGVVYKAEDPQLKRLVALKAMLPTMGAGESARKRFLREAQAAAAINHDNIVHIYQVGEDRGAPFIAMQFLEGESLETLLRRSSRLSPDQVLRIGRETAEGLAAAHQRGLIHRDIKPPNLWLEGQKRGVKILDFGIARASEDEMHLTQTGAIIGTVGYMAPEQASGKGVDHRSDLFSLGCVLYRMCTARKPFKGSDTISFLSALALEIPPKPAALNPEVPARLSDLIMRLLAKKPEKRPQSARSVAESLQHIEEEVGQATALYMTGKSGHGLSSVVRAVPGWSGRGRPPLPWLLGAAGGLLAVLIAGIVLFWPTPRGVIQIESSDPDVTVIFDKDGPTVKGAGAQPISLGAGEHGVHIKRGDFEFDADKFLIKKGDTVTLRVELLPGKIQVTADGRVIGAKEMPGGTPPTAPGRGNGTTLVVSKDGRGQFSTIQAAVRDAAPGARVIVRPGRYEETISISKPLEIVGDGDAGTVVIESIQSACVVVSADSVVVRRLTLKCNPGQSNHQSDTVCVPRGKNVLIEDCDVTSSVNSGFWIHGWGVEATVRRCKIHDCRNGGIMIASARVTCDDCVLSGNKLGMVSGDRAIVHVRKSRINANGEGVINQQRGEVTIQDCEILENRGNGIRVCEQSNGLIQGSALSEKT